MATKTKTKKTAPKKTAPKKTSARKEAQKIAEKMKQKSAGGDCAFC